VNDGGVESGAGWYYDDVSSDVAQHCRGDRAARIAYADGVQPPRAASVELACEAER
jgi:hypothetical protein